MYWLTSPLGRMSATRYTPHLFTNIHYAVPTTIPYLYHPNYNAQLWGTDGGTSGQIR
jgi:hypothetical protein